MVDRRPVPGLMIEQQSESVICALALCGEARGEQDAGGRLESTAMLAILWVLWNRVKDPGNRWPKTMRQAFLQPWQFSCFNPNDPNRARLLDLWKTDPVSWERADTVCDLFEQECTLDPTGDATHYCTKALWAVDDSERKHPRWHSRQEIEAGRTVETARWGHHVFARAA